MSKSKKVFIIIFSILLLVMSVGTISLYDNIQEKMIYFNQNNFSNYINRIFQMYSLSLIQEVDPEYELLSFNSHVTQKDRDAIKQLVNEELVSNREVFEEDKNFIYTIKNTKTNKVITNNKTNKKIDSYCFQQTLKYNTKGDLEGEGSLNEEGFERLDFDTVFEQLIYYDNDQEIIGDTVDVPADHVRINIPKNIEIAYSIPIEISQVSGITSYILNDVNQIYVQFTIIILIIYSFIIGSFILFYPIRIVEEVNPFLTVKKWKAEINVCLFGIILVLGVIATLFVTSYTLSHVLELFLNRFHIGNSHFIIVFINFIVWIITLLTISICIFEIKYMFADGFIRFLKEDTIIGSICRYIKRKLNKISQIDLSKPVDKEIMKYVIFNSIVIFICIRFFSFGYILAIIYAFVSFFWLKNKINDIQNDYNRLLIATRELGKGYFDEEINEDIGVFNGLKDEFNNIKIGFKKAVEEETKSQNMKTELISNVSHDLKTPLTCIKNYIVLLQDDNLTINQRHEYLDSLNQYSNRLTTLIEDLFEVSKVNSGNVQLNLVELNIIALLEQALAECNEILCSKDLTIINQFESNEILLYLDGDKTYRVFENLLTNISKYALSNSRVYIDVKEIDHKVMIEFKNISEAQMNFTSEEIIERFVRGDKSRHESGSGLGLAIAKSFVEVQGGQFEIRIDGDLFKAIITFNRS